MPKLLFFDTETNGLPANKKYPPSPCDNWPRVLQIAWDIWEKGERIKSEMYYVYPDHHIAYDLGAQKIHGITPVQLYKEGVTIQMALSHFYADWLRSDYAIAHNMEFDLNVIQSEMLRENMISTNDQGLFWRHGPKHLCTMKTSVEFCKIADPRGRTLFKYPKLSELYYKCFKTSFQGAHDASNDIDALARCFFSAPIQNWQALYCDPH